MLASSMPMVSMMVHAAPPAETPIRDTRSFPGGLCHHLATTRRFLISTTRLSTRSLRGNWLWSEARITSRTQWEEFFGIAPTGKHVTTTGTHLFRVADKKIVELWCNNDDLGVMRQLGVIS
ncbi:MAG TPA: ester cyclase [Ktedonobacteraceae bacterium]